MLNQPTKIKEASVPKIFQILRRQNENSSGPTIEDITPNQTSDDKPSSSTSPKKPMDTPQNTRLENSQK